MSFSRRIFLAGAATGVTTLVLAACTPDRPTPRPTASSPAPTTGSVPAPAAFLRSNWADDEFSRGSHSFIGVLATPDQRRVLRSSLDDRVFFAGEATSDDRPGTVEGAAESGVRAAAEVLDAAEPDERVVVIGAGAAGAAAAARLRDYGFEVTVIEARDRSGGRIATVETDEWPLPVELGATWAPESGSAVSLRLASLGVSTLPLDGDPLLRTGDGDEVGASDDGVNAIGNAITWAADEPNDLSLTDSLAGSGAGDLDDSGDAPTALDRLEQALLQRIGIGRGADPDELSSWYGLALPAAPTEELVTGGYARYIDDQLDEIDVWLSTPVTALSYGDNGVSIRLATGESVSVDRAVVTVPLGVLKSQGITFDPALPFEHRSAIAELGFGSVDTVWLTFDEPFWDTDAVRWSVFGSDLAVTEWLNLEPITGEAVLVGMVAGAQASALAELDDAAAQQAVSEALEPFVPVP